MIQKHDGKKYTNGAFVMEECFFVNCVLTDCDLFFSGGDVEWINTKFENCRFHWKGAALRTIQLMQMIGMLKVGPLPVPLPVEMGKVN